MTAVPNETRPLEVLLVEDNPGDAKLVRLGLEDSCPHLNIHIRLATDGEQALDAVLDDTYRPDLILLDLNLPKVGGHEILHAIRSGREREWVPIVVLTSSSAEADVRKAFDEGASAYTVKPNEIGQFINALKRIATVWLEPLAQRGAHG